MWKEKFKEFITSPWKVLGTAIFSLVAGDTATKYLLEGSSMTDLLNNLIDSISKFPDLPIIEFLMIPFGIFCFLKAGSSVNNNNERINGERMDAISQVKTEVATLVDNRLLKYDNQLNALFLIQTYNQESYILNKAIKHTEDILGKIIQSAKDINKKIDEGQTLRQIGRNFEDGGGETMFNNFNRSQESKQTKEICKEVLEAPNFNHITELPQNCIIKNIPDGNMRDIYSKTYLEHATILEALKRLEPIQETKFLNAKEMFHGDF